MLTTLAAALASSGSQPALPGFLEALSSPLQHYGLLAIFFLVLIEDFGVPVPGETVIIAGAIYAGSGRLNVVEVGVVAFVAAVFGDNIGYCIGRFGGRQLAIRWGKYVFLTPERLDRAEEFFERQGAKIITIARFIEGLRQANGIIAGIAKMHWLRFVAYNALGAALWVGTWVSIGYFAGQHITTIYNLITRYSLYVGIALVVAIVAFIARHLIRRRRRTIAAMSSPPGDLDGADAGDADAGEADADGKADGGSERADDDGEHAGGSDDGEVTAAAASTGGGVAGGTDADQGGARAEFDHANGAGPASADGEAGTSGKAAGPSQHSATGGHSADHDGTDGTDRPTRLNGNADADDGARSEPSDPA